MATRAQGSLACKLGYDPHRLAGLPRASTAAFSGVANPHAMGKIAAGSTVLDIGCGAGVDLLLAAEDVGPDGHVIGVDFGEPMCAVARASAVELGLDNVEIREGDPLELPVVDASVDVVISNGVLNRTSNKSRAFREILRVLKPGGRLHLADIIAERELSKDARHDIDLWAG